MFDQIWADAGPDGRVRYPRAVGTMAKLCDLSRRAAGKAVGSLAGKGFIDLARSKGGRPHGYRVRPELYTRTAQPTSQSDRHPEGAVNCADESAEPRSEGERYREPECAGKQQTSDIISNTPAAAPVSGADSALPPEGAAESSHAEAAHVLTLAGVDARQADRLAVEHRLTADLTERIVSEAKQRKNTRNLPGLIVSKLHNGAADTHRAKLAEQEKRRIEREERNRHDQAREWWNNGISAEQRREYCDAFNAAHPDAPLAPSDPRYPALVRDWYEVSQGTKP
ncbi:MAG: hypothetical protein ACF8NJ_02405 [Phycisphaerales bacterium JB038]